VGERWTLLILRDAFLGLRRFDEFQASLGIARNVLTDRLNRLVEEGILERVRYSERPERFEYVLTRKGRDLQIALVGLRQWATGTSARSHLVCYAGSRTRCLSSPRSSPRARPCYVPMRSNRCRGPG
jgi:DNA-binding HxlR family transcriptional regulator